MDETVVRSPEVWQGRAFMGFFDSVKTEERTEKKGEK